MEIELRYFEGCPNWAETDARLGRLLRELDIAAEVHRRRVESAAEAQRLGFRGSPTILIDGRDPFAHPDAPIGLSCRIYFTESGLAGSPSEAQLRTALTAGR